MYILIILNTIMESISLEVWHLWIVGALVLLIIEIFTPAFLSASIAVGCLCAAIVAGLGMGIDAQILFLALGTLAGFIGVRPVMLKYAYRKVKVTATNVDRLHHRRGYVSQQSEGPRNRCRVNIEGEDWMAETPELEALSVGQPVEVVKVDSTLLIVSPLINN
jgi:membrane protein implicated in regulation of membrane protease activity